MPFTDTFTDSCSNLPLFPSETPVKPGFPKDFKVVRTAGLEPAHLTALPPQGSASANFATCALYRLIPKLTSRFILLRDLFNSEISLTLKSLTNFDVSLASF